MSLKRKFHRSFYVLSFIAFSAFVIYACKTSSNHLSPLSSLTKGPKVLVFSKTKGYYHSSIPAGIAALQKLGKENGIIVVATKDAAYFNEDSLKLFSAVIFLNTTKNVLHNFQQIAFERFIQAGGGFVGIHSAADTEYNWPWYSRLVGAQFASHPKTQKAIVEVVDSTHEATSFLPGRWERLDEWYNFKNIKSNIKVLLRLDESTYQGGENGYEHPIAWYHEFEGGRAFYTGGGHTEESYSDPLFLKHLLGGINYAIGENKPLDYSKSYSMNGADENRFEKIILSNDLNEPMELAVAEDGRVFFIERSGSFYVYIPSTKETKLLHKFSVLPEPKEVHGNGLLGITLDPDFKSNSYIYFFYTPDKTPLAQHISRFKILSNGYLDLKSEKVIIKVPIDLEVSAHTGGSLTWDKDKNLYISTGDNTSPFESSGFSPLDERAGRSTFDAQRSSSNPNDLRGKILRIHPHENGSYSIPEGNLFPPNTPGTRPEIYVMGCRNPYRITVDQETSILYWGEIGPDSGKDGPQGPKGYDEFNQAKKPGNYGWPYFVGDSKPYKDYDFDTKVVGEAFDPIVPVNHSPNNTGLKNLPAAEKPIIWYPYDKSLEFSQVGVGGRSAMSGPVYHYNPSLPSKEKFPEYYDKALFIYDWMRNWVFAVRFDENQNFKRMEPFMQNNGNFKRPIDLEIGPEGAFYMLEYGSVYGIDNEDARLVKIKYNPGNRAPVAIITAKDTAGVAPLTVRFSSNDSYDEDEDDELKYEWRFEDNKVGSTEVDPNYTFTRNGVFKVSLTITDPSGLSSTDTTHVIVGNTRPEVKILSDHNSSFYFDEPFPYQVVVKDKEEAEITPENLNVVLKYLPAASNINSELGHQKLGDNIVAGKSLMEESDCKACHQVDKKSVGPAFIDIAKKYEGDKTALAKLANKVITGGGGVWGEHAMNAHPQLSKEDATEIVKYVLAIGEKKSEIKLPETGMLEFKEHLLNSAKNDRYILLASYIDNGGSAIPLSNSYSLLLRNSRVQVEYADKLSNLERYGEILGGVKHQAYFLLRNIDLKEIKSLLVKYSAEITDPILEVHANSPTGPVLTTVKFEKTGSWNNYKEVRVAIKDPGTKSDLYFVFKNEKHPRDLCNVDWVEFKRE